MTDGEEIPEAITNEDTLYTKENVDVKLWILV